MRAFREEKVAASNACGSERTRWSWACMSWWPWSAGAAEEAGTAVMMFENTEWSSGPHSDAVHMGTGDWGVGRRDVREWIVLVG